MRVATRRARAFLRAARPVLDQEWADELRAELGWLGSALGPARDLDVLVERMRGQRSRAWATTEPRCGASSTVSSGAVGRRRRSAVAALSEERYLALLDRLEDPQPPPPTGRDELRSPSCGGRSSCARAGDSRSSTASRATTSSTLRGSGSSAPGTRQSSPRTSSARRVSASSTRQRCCRTCWASIRTRSSPRSTFARGRKASRKPPMQSEALEARARAPEEGASGVARSLEAPRAAGAQGAAVIRAAGGVVLGPGESGTRGARRSSAEVRRLVVPEGEGRAGRKRRGLCAARGRGGDRASLRAPRGAAATTYRDFATARNGCATG